MFLARHGRFQAKTLAVSALALLFYNEFAVYWLNYTSWPSVHPTTTSAANRSIAGDQTAQPVRLLLVADPQLIGENDEPWYYGWIARWDADRYLRSTYTLARAHVQPDATIYLGDLFDEGLKATDEQFQRYLSRFRLIFQVENTAHAAAAAGAAEAAVSGHESALPRPVHIFIPGDNDIGGEYHGDRADHLLERFEAHFGPAVDIRALNGHIDLIKLDLDYTASFYNSVKRNFLLGLMAQKQQREEKVNAAAGTARSALKYRIILNHMSMLSRNRHELNALNEDTDACLVIKGDSHKFNVAKYSYAANRVAQSFAYRDDSSNYYILNLEASKAHGRIHTIYEISIPTCSYRMGVPDMGYGMLTIMPSGKAILSILWLPSRFFCLFYYVGFLTIVTLYFALGVASRRLSRVIHRLFTTKMALLFLF